MRTLIRDALRRGGLYPHARFCAFWACGRGRGAFLGEVMSSEESNVGERVTSGLESVMRENAADIARVTTPGQRVLMALALSEISAILRSAESKPAALG